MSSLPFTYQSLVTHGEKVGRTIGFPTANLATSPQPEELEVGVYLGRCWVNPEVVYDCLAYFGPRYIFGEHKNSFEVFIYDFAADIYHQTLSVTLTNYIRPPLDLDTIDKLKTQLEKDKQSGLKLLQST